jgi:hypothetical protein
MVKKAAKARKRKAKRDGRGGGATVGLTITLTADEHRLLTEAGYVPVLRWLHAPGRSERVYKTIDLLARIKKRGG